MATCPAQGPCILVIDASFAGFAPGTMPTLCAQCSLADYRTPSNSATKVANTAYYYVDQFSLYARRAG